MRKIEEVAQLLCDKAIKVDSHMRPNTVDGWVKLLEEATSSGASLKDAQKELTSLLRGTKRTLDRYKREFEREKRGKN